MLLLAGFRRGQLSARENDRVSRDALFIFFHFSVFDGTNHAVGSFLLLLRNLHPETSPFFFTGMTRNFFFFFTARFVN